MRAEVGLPKSRILSAPEVYRPAPGLGLALFQLF